MTEGTEGTDATRKSRSGARRGPRRKGRFQPVLLVFALGITGCAVAWGYLVFAAVDFGSAGRGGDAAAWWFLALAALGAVACLFVGLMLVVRLLRRLGITDPTPVVRTGRPTPAPTETTETTGRPRPIGGRHAG